MLDPIAHTEAACTLPATLRTEDVKFSPDGKILAAVASDGSILLFDLDILARPIEIRNCIRFKSESLLTPHGVAFLNDHTIVVANRRGGLTFYRIPATDRWTADMELDLLLRWESAHFGATGQTRKLRGRSVMCGPGSVRVLGNRLFVCCNNMSTVSAHRFSVENGAVAVHSDEVLAQQGLEIPDGVAVSRDERWMAISDHDHNRVVVYGLDTGEQSCVLRDPCLLFPHGLCFDPDGRRLIVADAGGQQLHVFCTAGAWDVDQDTSTLSRDAVEQAIFKKTQDNTPEQYRALEGGVKGLDIDPTGRVLATTCQNQILLFFKISPLLS